MTFSQFKETYQIRLNPAQEKAVQSVDGHILLLAVPGSGKTTVMIARIGWMILGLGIDPASILSLTYSVAAAAEMKKRYQERFGSAAACPEFRTINGLCARIILHYERVCGTHAFSLLEEEGQVRSILRQLYLTLYGEYPEDNLLRDLLTRMTFCRNNLLPVTGDPEAGGEDRLRPLWERYRQYKIDSRLMDYDDQMEYASAIFRRHPEILESLQNRWRYFAVDEAQDTSKIQHGLIRQLSGKSGNLFMVGDEDQSIYGFRAAYPQALLEFDSLYPDAQILTMEQNYRSTGRIVEAASALIAHNTQRRSKTMFTQNPPGAAPQFTVLRDIGDQYAYLCRIAGSCRGETALLYRNNESALPLIDLLQREGIPYRCRGSDGLFFAHPLVADLRMLLQFALAPQDESLFSRLYYKLGLGISKIEMSAALAAHAGEPARPLLESTAALISGDEMRRERFYATQRALNRIQRLDALSAIRIAMWETGFGKYQLSRSNDDGKLRILSALASQNPELRSFDARLSELSELLKAGSPSPDAKFLLSTIHAAKGLEFQKVILMDVRDGVLPMCGADKEIPEEERRLFYVGVTRAKEHLELLRYQSEAGRPAVRQRLLEELTPPAPTPASQSAPSAPAGSKPEKEPASAPAGSKPEKEPASAPARQNSKKEPASATARPTKAALLSPQELRTRCEPFTVGQKVRHSAFGNGEIISRRGTLAQIRFGKSVGTKTLSLDVCMQNGLLKLKK